MLISHEPRAAWQKRHHEQWGRVYEVKDVKIAWHVPSPEEIDFAIELLREIVMPALETVEGLLKEAEEGGPRSASWTNDFCRVSLSLVCVRSGWELIFRVCDAVLQHCAVVVVGHPQLDLARRARAARSCGKRRWVRC